MNDYFCSLLSAWPHWTVIPPSISCYVKAISGIQFAPIKGLFDFVPLVLEEYSCSCEVY
jgi:hypothetical protein